MSATGLDREDHWSQRGGLFTSSYPFGESVFFRSSVTLGLIGLLWMVLPTIVALGTLFGLAMLFGEPLHDYVSGPMLVVGGLCALIMQPARNMAAQLGKKRSAVLVEIGVRWVVLLFMLLMIGFITGSTPGYARKMLLTWATLTPTLIGFFSLGIQRLVRPLTLDTTHQRRVVFAGCSESSVMLTRRIKSHPEMCMSVAGFFDDRSSARLGQTDGGRLGGLNDLTAYARQHAVDVIFVALPIKHLQRVLDLLDELRDTTASIYYVPDIFSYDVIQARTGDLLGVPVVAMCETPLYGMRGLYKRLFDIMCAGLGLLVLAPFMLLIALAIRLTSPGGAIFRQRRYGLDGREIVVYKFRTMTVAEDGNDIRQAEVADKRVTAIGRFLRRMSIDELPQLVNVLQGTMSLVGPRPHAVVHNEIYRRLIKGYMIRHKVLPGITGLAQVEGLRGETRDVAQMQQRVRLDLEYLRAWSPWLDVRIILKTIGRVIADRNAY